MIHGENISRYPDEIEKKVPILLKFENGSILIGNELFESFDEIRKSNHLNMCIMHIDNDHIHEVLPKIYSYGKYFPKIFFWDKLVEFVSNDRPHYAFDYRQRIEIDYEKSRIELTWDGYDNKNDEKFDFLYFELYNFILNADAMRTHASSILKIPAHKICGIDINCHETDGFAYYDWDFDCNDIRHVKVYIKQDDNVRGFKYHNCIKYDIDIAAFFNDDLMKVLYLEK